MDWCHLVAVVTEWRWAPSHLIYRHKAALKVGLSDFPSFQEFLQAPCNQQCTRDLPYKNKRTMCEIMIVRRVEK